MFKKFCRPLPMGAMIAIIVAITAANNSGHHNSDKAAASAPPTLQTQISAPHNP